jgi:hypothetical protein
VIPVSVASTPKCVQLLPVIVVDGAPYGWRVGDDGKTLVAEEAEQETARRLRALRQQGWPYRQIRDEAARRGWGSRVGKAFTLQAVFEMTKDARPDELDGPGTASG